MALVSKIVATVYFVASRYAGINLPSYSFSGSYKATAECRAYNAPLYSDGLGGLTAWCAPTADVSSDIYLQVDFKNHFYIRTLLTQGLRSGRVTAFRLVHIDYITLDIELLGIFY